MPRAGGVSHLTAEKASAATGAVTTRRGPRWYAIVDMITLPK